MKPLATLRIPNAEGLAFAREKLRECLEAGGRARVEAAQVTVVVSQALRRALPAELTVLLSAEGTLLRIEADCLAQGRLELSLPVPVSKPLLLSEILGRLTREELLDDLERQVEERTADLQRERARSESLLLNMLPRVIAARMKRGETNIADAQVASVLFADLKGFTVLASQRSPEQIVTLLDRIFTEFDALAREHGLEKIKTIGDAYMAAAGLPLPQPDHVVRAARMALGMVQKLKTLRDELAADLDLRVGVHAGKVVAGVIGSTKFAYDIWGDTVNVASRLESHGAPGRVHVSEDFRRALPATFECEERGPIEVKGKGTMQTYWLIAERASGRS